MTLLNSRGLDPGAKPGHVDEDGKGFTAEPADRIVVQLMDAAFEALPEMSSDLRKTVTELRISAEVARISDTTREDGSTDKERMRLLNRTSTDLIGRARTVLTTLPDESLGRIFRVLLQQPAVR
jgi:hypothetical protein